jgi:tricorn protease
MAHESVASGQSEGPLLLQQPTLSATQIAFVFAGDLWVVGREGGDARRLTSHPGRETDPHFSPDGTLIAFTGEYDGNVDVYIVPAEGGVPRRLTYHPGYDQALGWTPDGQQVLFASSRSIVTLDPQYNRLFTIPLDGAFPEELPLPMAEEGSFSPDGARLAYVPTGRSIVTRESGVLQGWKHYRGGKTSPIWIANLSDSSIERIPRDNSNDFNPMWVGHRIYFLSDRTGPVTLFVYDTGSRKVTQVLDSEGVDIKSASAGPQAIAYEQFGSLHLFDLATGRARKLDIRAHGDLPEVRPRFMKVTELDRRVGLSPTGAHAVFEARGEIVRVSARTGEVRNLTNTSGIAERDPAWSPDGRWIAYFSDESGEYALHLRELKTGEVVRKISLVHPPFIAGDCLVWSPDSKKLAFTDIRMNLWYVDLERAGPGPARVPTRVDTDFSLRQLSFHPAWSADGRWLAYTKQLKSYMRALFVHELVTGKNYQLTDGMSDVQFPAFDRNGDYLYFTASTDIGPAMFGFDMSSFYRPVPRRVYALLLRKDLPSPLAPDDEEDGSAPTGGRSPQEKEPTPGDRQQARDVGAHPGVDLEQIEQRVVALPIPPRNYAGMVAGKAGTLFLLEREPFPGSTWVGQNLYRFDLATRKTEKLLEGIGRFALSSNGEMMLYRQGDRWAIVGTSQAPKPDEGTLKLEGMEIWADPRAGWRQMYHEAWRLQRDFFYDPGHHGLDLKAAEKQYEPYLENLSSRADLNHLFAEMFGELSVSHLFVRGGDQPEVKRVPVGMLGADYRIEHGRYRFARLYTGDPWNPEMRAPLTQPGVNVVAGEYLLAVNGRELRASDNVYSFFQGMAGKRVRIRVGPDPTGAASREATVVPVESERLLRHFAWIEGNRRKVEAMSGGRVAYVYLPNVWTHGYANFNRYYFAQADRDGLVIDERFNTGGVVPDYILDYLRRPLMNYWALRTGMDWRTPQMAILGPKVMIINEYAGSGGDNLPWLFRRAGIGPLVGERTWGGEVGGTGGVPKLIDGGFVVAPDIAFYSPEGEWEIENHGVSPDIEVEIDPRSWRAGRDPQLEKAVAVVMEALQKNPLPKPKRPAFPNYHPAAGPAAGRRQSVKGSD